MSSTMPKHHLFNVLSSSRSRITTKRAVYDPLRLASRKAQGRSFSSTAPNAAADFTHAVIGGGAVGLAIARRLQSRPGAATVLIERHGRAGSETSSRNSEVIHAGIYYGQRSKKARLCLRGKALLYELCERHDIAHRRCGKWVVAQDGAQLEELDKLHEHMAALDVPRRFVPAAEVRRREPDVRAEAGVLESPSTGILDSHAFMQFLQADFERMGGVVAFNSPVSRLVPLDAGHRGWEVHVGSSAEEHGSAPPPPPVVADTLVNSAGLAAIPLSNSILPPERRRKPYYAKGSYFSYSASHPKPKTLIYPAPKPGLGGLGSHLTLDITGRVRFGPDVEWVDDPSDYSVNHARMAEAVAEIAEYLPGIDKSAIATDYSGIRPKLGKGGAVWKGDGKDFLDFYIENEHGFEGWINLLGIESPGLTSSLAIAEEVELMLYGNNVDSSV